MSTFVSMEDDRFDLHRHLCQTLVSVDFTNSSRRPTQISLAHSTLRTWIRVDASRGLSEPIELDRLNLMRRCDLPLRDLRLIDPAFAYPPTILGREKAIVVNLEHVRCVITAEEVFVVNSLDLCVWKFVTELQRRTAERRKGDGVGDGTPLPSSDSLPFELMALEVALESVNSVLNSQAVELEGEAYPLLNKLTSNINTLKLEQVRLLKSRLVSMTRKVQKIRDEVEQLMNDDGDMAEMYLTDKKKQLEATFHRDQESISAKVPHLSGSIIFEKSSSTRTSVSISDKIEALEMLLEAYFVVIDKTLSTLTTLKEYIDDTEDFINIQLDNERNQMIKYELVLTIAMFVVDIFGVVAGIFGMNFTEQFFNQPQGFQRVLSTTGASCLIIFCVLLLFTQSSI